MNPQLLVASGYITLVRENISRGRKFTCLPHWERKRIEGPLYWFKFDLVYLNGISLLFVIRKLTRSFGWKQKRFP